MSGTEIALLIGAFLTGTAGLITAITAARKSQLDALMGFCKLIQEDNTRIIAENKRLVERIEHLECELEERDGTLEQIKKWAEILVGVLKDNKIPVPPMPDKTPTRPRQSIA